MNNSRPAHKPGRHERKDDMIEKVIEIDRVSRTVKGGRRIRFRALVVVGDGKGNVGMGIGKAGDVSKSIAKANTFARHHMQKVLIVSDSIPYEVLECRDGASVHLKPAPKGTSVIAGGTIRAIVEAAGIKNIVAKSLGSANKINIAKATLGALDRLKHLSEKYQSKPETNVK